MLRKQSAQTEISHLIADAVSHAVARRSQVETEESLTTLSDGETGKIMGGLTSEPITVKYPITAGNLPVPGLEVI